MWRFTRGRAALVAGLLLVGLTPMLVAATSGGAATRTVALSCGDTVMTSVTLTADITNCTGYGLIAGHGGITINLNGHRITGSSSTHIGLWDESFASVVFENGTVAGFVRGVEIDAGSATIKGLRVSANTDAGIYTFFPATITGNTVYGNGNDGIVVGCCASDKSTITGNTVTGNTGIGILVSFTAASSTVSSNRVLSNTGNGIFVGADGAAVTGNTANANGGSGLVIGSSDQNPPLKATANVADDNTSLGIELTAGDTDGGTNKASGNGSAHQCENVVCSTG
jgi:parallel beta-helix repeat protein